eukprot:scaffold11253_cov66-Skeletonema_marinoi.AAC.1
MSKRVNNIPSAGDKKRKEVSVAANNESSPPKKRYRYECSVDGCGNWRIEGGVCVRHGAKKKKACSVDDCTNQAISGGVCLRHGAKLKRCSVDDCTNIVVKGGVCWTHGAKVEAKRCSVDGCTNQRQRRGVCKRHRTHSNIAPPPAQENFLCGNVQGGGNQNNASTVVEISDNEGEGGKNQSPIAGRKRKAGVGKQQSEAAATSNDARDDGPGEFVQEIPEKKDAVVDGQNDESDKSSSGVANLKDDNEQEASDMRAQKRARGEGNLKDDREQDASDVAPTQGGGEGERGDAMEDGDSWGGDGQIEYDCGGGDDGDLNSEEGKQSHVVPDEIVTTGANDVENDSEIQRLATELQDANKTVDTLNDRLKEMSNEFEAAQSRSKSEHEQQQSELIDLRNRLDILSSQFEKKTVDAARLEASLRSKEAEMQSAVLASAAQLKEANDKVAELSAKLEEADKDGTEKIQRQINTFHSMQEGKLSLQSKILRLEQQLRSSKSEQDNLKSALAKGASKNQTHCTRSTSITSSRKRFSKKNSLLVGVDSLSTLVGEGTTSTTSSRKRLGKKNKLLGVPILSTLGEEGTTSITSSRKRRGKKNSLLGVPFLSTLGEEGSR